jgi:putative ABC transport system permease protein
MLDSILGYADYNIISEMMNMPKQSLSYRVVTDRHTWEDQEEIGRAVDNYMRARGFQVGDVEAGKATMRDASEAISVLIGFLLIMALLTALVGSIGLTGTMGMNVLERTREIGVMRAIGAVDLKIVNSVIVEALLIGIISWFFAILISFPISYGLLGIISNAMINAPIPLTITAFGSVLWLGVVILLSIVASVLPARNAARLTIREVLAY